VSASSIWRGYVQVRYATIIVQDMEESISSEEMIVANRGPVTIEEGSTDE
jgi:hypothetical protein